MFPLPLLAGLLSPELDAGPDWGWAGIGSECAWVSAFGACSCRGSLKISTNSPIVTSNSKTLTDGLIKNPYSLGQRSFMTVIWCVHSRTCVTSKYTMQIAPIVTVNISTVPAGYDKVAAKGIEERIPRSL